MKYRISVLGFAALMLVGSWAKAETSAPPPAPTAPAATATAPGAAPFCAASLFNVQSTDFTPKPSQRVTPTCGPCSYSSCQGQAFNSSCYYLDRFGYHLAKCVVNYSCGDGTNGCDCTNNPPV